jgi:Nucleotidyl transferase AbiEii toxin, Type IV TA system
MNPRYATARAFRTALEERLKQKALTEQLDLARLRRQIAFQRFLARLFANENAPWLLKGGHAFELWLPGRARATKDIDLTIPHPVVGDLAALLDATELRDRLQDAAERDLGDWFEFRVAQPRVNFDAPPDGGARFPVSCRLDAREFTNFTADIGLGDVVTGEPHWMPGPDLLAFAEIPPARIRSLPPEQQFAEKAHAYTLPRKRTNSRVKDLVDLLFLLDEIGLPEPERVATAIKATFKRRATHPLPSALPEPPAEWEETYAALVAEYELPWVTLELAQGHVSSYWQELWPPEQTARLP